MFSSTAPVEAGDFVGVWFAPGVTPPGEMNRWVKRLTFGLMPGCTFPYKPEPGDGFEPMVVLEMLNPPKRFTFRASQILAKHKVIGEADRAPDGRTCLPRAKIEDAGHALPKGGAA